ncbi:hypothetical protein DYI95_002830 [Thermaerobacter sp. PB12/4term]|uniref:hypothetical protein n=1 Tax=Thermaerobacter sp. PB12/4term TaxID=2293838 RepID=UPI001313E962|nr:hypothetical protein [Thermaerobacter sp. PB12/4term]QIA26608.1 hypothetical protein DYI95_002830 [Thermaerobacter sp. PB12/4term]
MTSSPVDEPAGRRIAAALWGLACGEAVGRAWGSSRAASGLCTTPPAGPAGLRVGPATRLVIALARAVAAGEGRVDPSPPVEVAAALAGSAPGPLDPALWAVVAGLINRPDDLQWLVEDGVALVQAVAGAAPVPPPAPAALAAAAAVAAAVSAAVAGEGPEAVLDRATEAAAAAVGVAGSAAGGEEPAAAVAHALDTLRLTLAGRGAGEPPGHLAAILRSRWEPGLEPGRAVPFALVLAAACADAGRAVQEAAGAALPGAAPVVTALAGCVAGALAPASVPAAWTGALDELAQDMERLVPELARLR